MRSGVCFKKIEGVYDELYGIVQARKAHAAGKQVLVAAKCYGSFYKTRVATLEHLKNKPQFWLSGYSDRDVRTQFLVRTDCPIEHAASVARAEYLSVVNAAHDEALELRARAYNYNMTVPTYLNRVADGKTDWIDDKIYHSRQNNRGYESFFNGRWHHYDGNLGCQPRGVQVFWRGEDWANAEARRYKESKARHRQERYESDWRSREARETQRFVDDMNKDLMEDYGY